MKRWRLVTLAALASALSGCGGLPQPTAVDAERVGARWPGLRVADLEQGRELYVGRCAACHQLYEPASFGSERWQLELRKMRERARLSEQQELRILQYLLSVAGRTDAAAASAEIDQKRKWQ